MIRRPTRSTLDRSSAASDVYKRQDFSKIQFSISGSNVHIDSDGNLIYSSPFGIISEDQPIAIQDGKKLKASWVLKDGIVSISVDGYNPCLLYTSPSPRDRTRSRMPSSA